MGFEILALVLMVGFVGAVHAWDRVRLRYAASHWLSQRTRLAERLQWTVDTSGQRIHGTIANGCALTIAIRMDSGDLRADWRVHLEPSAACAPAAREAVEGLALKLGHFPDELRGIVSPGVEAVGDPAFDRRVIVRSVWTAWQTRFLAEDHRARIVQAIDGAHSEITLEDGVIQVPEFARESIEPGLLLLVSERLAQALLNIADEIGSGSTTLTELDAIALFDSAPGVRRIARRHARLALSTVLLADDESAVLEELRVWAASQSVATLKAVCSRLPTASPAPGIVLQTLLGKDPTAFSQELGRLLLRAPEADGQRLAEQAGRDTERLPFWLRTLVRLPPCPAGQALLRALPPVSDPQVMDALVLLAVQGPNEYAGRAVELLRAVGDRRHVGPLLQKSEQWTTPADLRQAMRVAVGAMAARGHA